MVRWKKLGGGPILCHFWPIFWFYNKTIKYLLICNSNFHQLVFNAQAVNPFRLPCHTFYLTSLKAALFFVFMFLWHGSYDTCFPLVLGYIVFKCSFILFFYSCPACLLANTYIHTYMFLLYSIIETQIDLSNSCHE